MSVNVKHQTVFFFWSLGLSGLFGQSVSHQANQMVPVTTYYDTCAELCVQAPPDDGRLLSCMDQCRSPIQDSQRRDFAAGIDPSSVALGDFNGDNLLDVAVANAGSNDVSILLADPTPTDPYNFTLSQTISVGSRPSSIAVGKFRSGTNPLDLAVANRDSNDVYILLGNGDGTFQSADVSRRFTVGSNPSAIVTKQFRSGTNPLDLAVANENSNTVSILLGNGSGGFTAGQVIGAGTKPSSVVVEDFNGDNKPDLAVANRDSNNVYILLGNGDGTFQSADVSRRFAVGSNPSAIAVGKFRSGTNPLDLAVANEGSNSVSILLGDPANPGRFLPGDAVAVGSNPSAVLAVDLDGDGIGDLTVANKGSGPDNGNLSIFLGRGNGRFWAATPPTVGRFCTPSSLAYGISPRPNPPLFHLAVTSSCFPLPALGASTFDGGGGSSLYNGCQPPCQKLP